MTFLTPHITDCLFVLQAVAGPSPGEEVRELEEYARQYEVTGRGSRAARATPASGRDSATAF